MYWWKREKERKKEYKRYRKRKRERARHVNVEEQREIVSKRTNKQEKERIEWGWNKGGEGGRKGGGGGGGRLRNVRER